MTSILNICHLLSRSIPGRTPSAFFRQSRVLMYALLNPSAARVWLGALTSNSLLGGIAVRNRRFLERPFHRFIQANMTARERAKLLCGHFQVVQDLFRDDLVRNLYLKGNAVTLASSGRYAIVVSEPVRCWREGLLTIAWRDEIDRIDLAWATISFERHAETGKLSALIGGLQGPGGADRDRVRDATRACHGLRPKAAVMEAVCVLSRMANVQVLTGVSKKTHISATTSIQFCADYDGFWQEIGGIETDGRFVLPLHPYHRDISEVPSHRRSAFRKRQALIADLLEQITSAVGTDMAQPWLPSLAVEGLYCEA